MFLLSLFFHISPPPAWGLGVPSTLDDSLEGGGNGDVTQRSDLGQFCRGLALDQVLPALELLWVLLHLGAHQALLLQRSRDVVVHVVEVNLGTTGKTNIEIL